jgi:hypothetical protein
MRRWPIRIGGGRVACAQHYKDTRNQDGDLHY